MLENIYIYKIFFVGLEFNISQTNPAINENTVFNPKLLEEWYVHGRGPLTVPVTDGLGYIKSPSGKDLEIILIPLGRIPNSFSIAIMLQQPDARGNVILQSKDPLQPPIMSYNYFDNKSDLDDNIYGLKFIMKLIEETRAFKNVTPTLNPYPKCGHEIFKSDDYLICLSKHLTFSYQHHCSTCRMGDVVNSKLQVIGVEGLRVIDSSIFPYIPSSHLYAPTLMVGEKGADIVRSYWS